MLASIARNKGNSWDQPEKINLIGNPRGADLIRRLVQIAPTPTPAEGVLSLLDGMAYDASMGSHFNDWIDHNGAAFSTELLEWGHTFSEFRGRLQKIMVGRDL